MRYSFYRLLPHPVKENYIKNIEKQTPLVDLFAFAIMPNHFHLLLKQLYDKGISTFISNIQNGFAKFFNLKNDRHGTLFQNPFKAKIVETHEEFIHISRYIHLNPITSFIIDIDHLKDYPWTSMKWYMRDEENKFINKNYILESFKNAEEYFQFVRDQSDYQRHLGIIKHLTLEGKSRYPRV